MSLQGVASVMFIEGEQNQIHVRFATRGFARLADNILRDTVEGVRLVLNADVETPPDADWWAGSVNQMTASVRAMQGVIESRGFVEHGQKELQFVTSDAATSARIRSLVNEEFDGWSVSFTPFGIR
jgi:hypothetical protein